MEIVVSPESIKNSKFVFQPNEHAIQICPYCDAWWREDDLPKHNIDCNRPQQGP